MIVDFLLRQVHLFFPILYRGFIYGMRYFRPHAHYSRVKYNISIKINMNSRIEVIKKKPLYDVMGELTYFKCFERKKNISTLIEFLHFRPQYIYKNIK